MQKSILATTLLVSAVAIGQSAFLSRCEGQSLNVAEAIAAISELEDCIDGTKISWCVIPEARRNDDGKTKGGSMNLVVCRNSAGQSSRIFQHDSGSRIRSEQVLTELGEHYTVSTMNEGVVANVTVRRETSRLDPLDNIYVYALGLGSCSDYRTFSEILSGSEMKMTVVGANPDTQRKLSAKPAADPDVSESMSEEELAAYQRQLNAAPRENSRTDSWTFFRSGP